MSDIEKLHADIETLRGAILELIPILDWAAVKATRGSGDTPTLRYIDATSKIVRNALDTTTPMPKDGGKPRAKILKGD